MSEPQVEVAASGTLDRSDRCQKCGKPMLYRCDEDGVPVETFCGNGDCELFLLDFEVPRAKA